MDFIENSAISCIYRMLEESKVEGQAQNKFTEDHLIDLANYLSFFGTFWGLIKRGVVQLETLDPVLAYRFLLATNNRFVQEMLLCCPGKEIAWKNIYCLHNAWRRYRIARGLCIWQEDYDLSRCEAYPGIASTGSG
jgi:hypothetical protein